MEIPVPAEEKKKKMSSKFLVEERVRLILIMANSDNPFMDKLRGIGRLNGETDKQIFKSLSVIFNDSNLELENPCDPETKPGIIDPNRFQPRDGVMLKV